MTKRVFHLTGGALPIFSWRLPKEIASYKQSKLPAGQWINVIKGFSQKGIKAAEIEDSKVISWLEEQGPGQISREDVAEYVSYSLPAIKEARLSGGDVHYQNYSWADSGQDYNESLFYFPTVTEDMSDRIADLDDAIAAINFDFEQLARDPDIVFRLDAKREELVNRSKKVQTGAEIGSHFASRLQQICPDARADFAHMRWSVLTLNGQRTLFIHEFQSDWAQRGRREAVSIQRKEMAEAIARHLETMSAVERSAYDAAVRAGQHASADQEKAFDELYVKYVGQLPGAPEWKGQYKKAPLVTETEYWTGFLVRRAMTLAVEMDCKQMTWINGSAMVNGARARGGEGLNDFYRNIVTNIVKRMSKPFKSELALQDIPLRGETHRLAVMPVTTEMKENLVPRVPVYSYAKVVEAATYDPVRAEQLRRTLQSKADKMLGKDSLMRVKIVREILDACDHHRPAGALIGRVAEVAFNAEDPVAALNHEGFHFAYRYLFTSKEIEAINREFAPGTPLLARTMRILMARGEVDAAAQAATNPEEAAAHAFALWKRGQMPLNKVSALAPHAQSRRGITRIITEMFPAAERFVETVCQWMRGTSVSPSDFVARIVRVHGEVPRAMTKDAEHSIQVSSPAEPEIAKTGQVLA